MIPAGLQAAAEVAGKPRASGDDPTTMLTLQLDVW